MDAQKNSTSVYSVSRAWRALARLREKGYMCILWFPGAVPIKGTVP